MSETSTINDEPPMSLQEHKIALDTLLAGSPDITEILLAVPGDLVKIRRDLSNGSSQTTNSNLMLSGDLGLNLHLSTSRNNRESPRMQSAQITLKVIDPQHAVITNDKPEREQDSIYALPARTPLSEIELALEALKHYMPLPQAERDAYSIIRVMDPNRSGNRYNDTSAEEFVQMLEAAQYQGFDSDEAKRQAYFRLDSIFSSLRQPEKFKLLQATLAVPIREGTDIVDEPHS